MLANKPAQHLGFTLLEILIALFVFTILAGLMGGALHQVIGFESRTQQHAEKLHELQRALLIVSRDIEQAVNRPILKGAGKEEGAFVGSDKQMTFTHTGAESILQRNRYVVRDNQLTRVTWGVLDQAPSTQPTQRTLLSDANLYFEYLDKDGGAHSSWPLNTKKDEKLPHAVRIYITLPNWGKMSQLYLLGAQ